MSVVVGVVGVKVVVAPMVVVEGVVVMVVAVVGVEGVPVMVVAVVGVEGVAIMVVAVVVPVDVVALVVVDSVGTITEKRNNIMVDIYIYYISMSGGSNVLYYSTLRPKNIRCCKYVKKTKFLLITMV